jgi:hypothetical protein
VASKRRATAEGGSGTGQRIGSKIDDGYVTGRIGDGSCGEKQFVGT